ncbi:MAG: chromosomal replication initiator protein DnaA [Patescibacteria group bacterium]|nr:chromosomal replication initiator protein DnaA [Patescibacteria group bacterium]MDD5490941.1 chromosomal replication initiator protein DnaA [Patescibacteria group bacterium]
MQNDQLWQAVLGELELQLSKANFTTWFRGTFISSREESKVIVGVPNAFTKSWLEKKYHESILKALQSLTERQIREIFFKVETKKLSEPEATNLIRDIKKIEQEETEPALSSFGLNNRYTFDKFIVGKGNELAYAACKAVAQTPGKTYNPLFIYGGVGLGKTHLLQAVGHALAQCQNCKIMYVTSEKFTNEYIQAVKNGRGKEFKDAYRNVDLLLIDDIQFIAGKEGTQEEFFHTFNHLHQSNKQIVLTSDRPPKAIPALEKRLLSRFEWGMIADVSAPDLETRIAILEAKLKEKNYALEREIVSFIASHVQNNIRELEGALNRIMAFNQFNNTPINLENVKNILSTISRPASGGRANITPKTLIKTVAEFYDLAIEELIGKSREKRLAYPRQIIMYLMREEVQSSYPAIGQELGGRDHTTAMHAYHKIIGEIENCEKTKQEISAIKERLYNC